MRPKRNVTDDQARTVGCPNCKSLPGKHCTQPTDNDRRAVRWVHLARETEYLDQGRPEVGKGY